MTLREFKSYCDNKLSEIYASTEVDTFYRYLLESFLGIKSIDISLNPSRIIPDKDIQNLQHAIERLQQYEPIQYILEQTEFYGLEFKVNKNVLIPRPETEELVEWILKDVEELTITEPFTLLDMGTGSGCIPITLKKLRNDLHVCALDISQEALSVARSNAEMHQVDIDFKQGDMLSLDPLENSLKGPYDIIVSNPPYVRELEKEEILPNVLHFEPHQALFVPDHDALCFYEAIAEFANKNLKREGTLYVEINQYLGPQTLTLLKNKGFKALELRKDFAGKDRMIKAKRI